MLMESITIRFYSAVAVNSVRQTTRYFPKSLFALCWQSITSYFKMIPKKNKLEASTARLQILALRSCFCLPFYGLLIWLCVMEPKEYSIIMIFVTFMEGFSFYTYVSLVITNCGGSYRFVDMLKQSGKFVSMCGCCCSKDFEVYYKRATWAIWHFWWTRTALAVLVCLCTEAGGGRLVAKAFSGLFSLAGAFIAFYAIISFLLMCKHTLAYMITTNISGVSKFLLVKMSVGAIVLLGLVAQFLLLTGAGPYTDDSNYSEGEKTTRGYCILVLLDFVFLSMLAVYAFASKITPPISKEVILKKVDVHGFSGLLYEVFCTPFDVLGTITYQFPSDSDPAELILNVN
eukprot:gene27927-36789_t